MLQKLRDNTSGWIGTVILVLLCVPFAFFGMESYMQQQVETYVARVAQPPSWWHSAPNVWPLTYLWSVHDIGPDEYRERLELLRTQTRERLGDNFDAKEFESVENKRKIIDTLIDDQLMRLAAERTNIVISDAQVRDTINTMPAFQVDGAFNIDRYRLLLASQNPPMSARDFDAKIRAGLRDELVPSAIAQSAFVTKSELDRLMRLLSEHRDVTFAALPPPAKDTAPVTPAQVEAWYKAHKSEYRQPETVRLEYVEVATDNVPAPAVDEATLRGRYQQQIAKYASPERRDVAHILIAVPANASNSDKQAAEAKAKKLAEQARAPGADFAALAKANSDDAGSKGNGGDLGWITKGSMPEAFDAAAFAMKPGDVRGPIRSDFGWHIIELKQVQPGVQKSFEDVRADLAKELQEGDREREFNELVGKLVDAVYKNPTSLEPAAKALGLQVQTTPSFGRAGAPGIASNQKVLREAFSDALIQDGTASDPIELGTDRTVLIRVLEHKPERAQPLAEVQTAIAAEIHADRERKAATAAADALVAQARKHGLAEAARVAGIPTADMNDIGRGAPVPSPAAVQAFFNVPRPSNNVIPVEKLRMGDHYLVFAVRAVRDGDLSQVPEAESKQLRQQISTAMGMEAQRAFAQAARTKYTIKVAEDRL